MGKTSDAEQVDTVMVTTNIAPQFHYVVTVPILQYQRGDKITDPAAIEEIKRQTTGHEHHMRRVPAVQ